jgi:hypothetical protein
VNGLISKKVEKGQSHIRMETNTKDISKMIHLMDLDSITMLMEIITLETLLMVCKMVREHMFTLVVLFSQASGKKERDLKSKSGRNWRNMTKNMKISHKIFY